MSAWLQPALALLDEGLALYRRHFGSFLLIAAGWCIPVAIGFGLAVVAASWISDAQAILLLLGVSLLLIPLSAYLLAGLSRAADAAAAGQPIRLRTALRIHPLRVASMGVFALVYSLLMQTVAFSLAMFCLCPAYVAGLFVVGGLSSMDSSDPGTVALGVLGAVVFFGIPYLILLVIGGLGYSSMVYALQPWVLDRLRFGEAIQRSLELIVYRFRANAVVWGASAMLVTAAGLSVAAVIGLVVPLPILWLLGEESELAQGIAAAAWMAGLIVTLPPLPIWMALLYRRNLAAREGEDLEKRIGAWLGTLSAGDTTAEPLNHGTAEPLSQEHRTDNQELRDR
jgi:hypothetical protein